ncbi:MAG: hypothetical protein GWN93_20860 [Deltaproteobacteria bacterium]|nr:hypothetical protein [Deltaproteobacteria bacterium]
MGYLQDYKKALDSGRLQRLTYAIHQWKEEDQLVIGRLIGMGIFDGGKFDNPVNYYMLDTDEGMVSCILGSATDEQIRDNIDVGNILAIHYKGKRELEDGRKVNIFEIDVLPDSKSTPNKPGKSKKGGVSSG